MSAHSKNKPENNKNVTKNAIDSIDSKKEFYKNFTELEVSVVLTIIDVSNYLKKNNTLPPRCKSLRIQNIIEAKQQSKLEALRVKEIEEAAKQVKLEQTNNKKKAVQTKQKKNIVSKAAKQVKPALTKNYKKIAQNKPKKSVKTPEKVIESQQTITTPNEALDVLKQKVHENPELVNENKPISSKKENAIKDVIEDYLENGAAPAILEKSDNNLR